jgi:hypothetical protein
LPKRPLLFLLVSAGLVPYARAVELHIQFGALERLLAEQLFTQEGRRYMRGDSRNKCNFAFLEKPRISEDSGRLRIRARFSGRSSLNMFGSCVGMGDAFDVVIRAAPEYRDGNLRLRAVKVESDGKTGFYIRRVCSAMETTLAHEFKYPLENQAARILEDTGLQPGYTRELHGFTVPEIRVSREALVLVLDFQLTVK